MVRSGWRLSLVPAFLLVLAVLFAGERVEVGAHYRQFAPGAEHLRLPPLLLYSLQMTSAFAHRSYLRLTLESMR